ncbi:MAG: anti-sigma factor domain-containing protein [Gammaproteobacteria bacterium]
MSASHIKIDPHLEELLIDQALFGLDESENAELHDLLGKDPDELEVSFMRTAALAQLGLLSSEQKIDKMPGSLRDNILSAAPGAAHKESNQPDNVVNISDAKQPPAAKPANRLTLTATGWGMAAALAIALVFVQAGLKSPDSLSARADLLASVSDTLITPWAKPEIAGYEQVTGDVVWSDTEQSGYMRLAGLPANDPAVAQYQLWIVDPERSPQPVDGGVFDIPTGTREAIVPINAKLAVDAPTVFAITLEQPGGVVVSEGPLLIIAATGS